MIFDIVLSNMDLYKEKQRRNKGNECEMFEKY
jgi:hypothetical protein